MKITDSIVETIVHIAAASSLTLPDLPRNILVDLLHVAWLWGTATATCLFCKVLVRRSHVHIHQHILIVVYLRLLLKLLYGLRTSFVSLYLLCCGWCFILWLDNAVSCLRLILILRILLLIRIEENLQLTKRRMQTMSFVFNGLW